MKKRISALVLSSCLLAGCAGQGAAATGETAAPSQAVPTAAPQSLTVNGLLDTSAAVGALELYAQAQNVTLQNSFETETADLVILDRDPLSCPPEELRDIQAQRKKEAEAARHEEPAATQKKTAQKTTRHQQPKPKKKPKSKER